MIGEDGGDRADQADGVEPDRGVNSAWQIFSQSYLQQKCRQADRGDHDESKRARESCATGVENDERESE